MERNSSTELTMAEAVLSVVRLSSLRKHSQFMLRALLFHIQDIQKTEYSPRNLKDGKHLELLE